MNLTNATVQQSMSMSYAPVPANAWIGIYPPILPPPHIFDLEDKEKWLTERLFKRSSDRNPLYDETDRINLPTDEKGILILDPVLRTRITDVVVELDILWEYWDWIESARNKAAEGDMMQGLRWLEGLTDAVAEDWDEADGERNLVVDEERRRRGLSDRGKHLDWWYAKSYGMGIGVDKPRSACSEENGSAESPAPVAATCGEKADMVIIPQNEAGPLCVEHNILPLGRHSSTVLAHISDISAPPVDLFWLWC